MVERTDSWVVEPDPPGAVKLLLLYSDAGQVTVSMSTLDAEKLAGELVDAARPR